MLRFKTYQDLQKFEVSNHVRSGPNFPPYAYIQSDSKHSRDITIHYIHVYICYTHLIVLKSRYFDSLKK